MDKFWELLSEDEKTYEYFGSGYDTLFNDEDKNEELLNIERRGKQIAKTAAETSANTKLLAKLVLEKLDWLPGSLHDLTKAVHYDPRYHNNDIVELEELYKDKRATENILFFNVLPELINTGKIKCRDVMKLGSGRENVYYL